jgi:hypothetical protein
MDFKIESGSATNLPKEMVDKLIEIAVEKSVVLRLADARNQFIEVVNEGTIPVVGAEDLTKFYRIDGTSDITELPEHEFDIQSPDLLPVEVGTWMRIKKKHIAQYPKLKIDKLFKDRLSRGVARLADQIGLVGDEDATSAPDALSIADGIVTLAGDATTNASTAVTYTSSNAQAVLNAVAEAVENIGVYGADEYIEDLVIFGSSDFVKACKSTASKDYIGYEITDYAPLGLKKVVTLHGIPVIRRLDISGEQAVLANVLGAYCGYYGKMDIDVEHEAARRGDLLVITFWFDFKWGLLDSSSKALGLVKISKIS